MLVFLLLVSILPLQQHPFWSRFAGQLTIIKYVGVLCLMYAVLYRLRRGGLPRYFGTWSSRFYILFFALELLSYVRGGRAFSWSYSPILTQSSFLLFFFLVPAVVDTVKRLRWTLLVTIGSMAWASLYVIREWQKNRGWATGYRPGWVVGDANLFAISAVLVIPLAWYMSQEKRPRWEHLFCLGCMALILTADVIGASRGGFLGLAAALFVVAWHSRKRARNLAFAAVLLAIFNVAYPFSPLHRFLHPDAGSRFSEDAHEAQFHAAFAMIAEHPLGGIGLGNFKSRMLDYAPSDYWGPSNIAHDAYLAAASEAGVPALICFATLLLALLRNLGRLRLSRSAPPLVRQAAVGLQAGLCGAMVSIGFVYALDLKGLWLFIFLSMCLPALGRPHARQRGKQQEPAAARFSRIDSARDLVHVPSC